MSNIISYEEFKKKNKTNLPTQQQVQPTNTSNVISYDDFRVRNNAQNFLKNSAQAKFYNYLTQPKQVDTQQDKRNTWINTGAKGNIVQKGLGTVADIGYNVLKGVAGAGEKLGDLASYGVAGIADVLGAKDYAKNVRESAQINLVGNALQPVTNQVNQYSLTGDKLDSIVQSVGESYAMAQVGGALGKTKVAQKVGLGDALNKSVKLGKLNINIPLMSVLTGASSGITEAYQKGGDNQQAFIKGLTSGLAEGISEGIFGVFGQGGSSFEQEVMYKATKKIENELARRLTKLGITAAGEGAEEGISYAFNYVADNLQDIVNTSLGKEINKMGSKWDWNEFGENILSGAIAGGLSGGAELLGGGRGAAILESTQHQVENTLNRALTDAEVATLAQETEKQLNNGKINIDQIVNRLQNPTVEDLVQQQGIKSDTTPQLDSGLQQQLQLPAQNFTVDTSGYSGTQLQTYQNAINSGLLNNNKNTHDFVDFVSRISKDKGIVFNFTNNQALQDRNINAQINGFIDNNGITLNVDSNMALEKVIGHEITHTLEDMANEYNSLKNSFKTLLGEEYNTRLEQIKELYSGIEGANYENELISDLAGEYLFTNEEFINRLSTQKPSLFRRIYEEIKYLWKMATGTEQEKQLARTMRIYEQAYRNAGKVSNYNVDNFAQNTQNVQETQITPQEVVQKQEIKEETKPEVKKYPNLTEEEAKEYEFLDSLPFDLTGEDLQTYERLQRKMEGKPILPTRKDIQFKDIARDYGKYKDLEGYNSELTKDAESLVPDRQGRRTKEQWLDVASFIGERFKGTDEQLKKYAIQSWLAERPNNKDRLNRQGKGYVKFTIEEWMNKIYESANRTKPITQYSLSKELDDYVTNNNYSFKDNGNLEVKNLTDKQIKDLVKIYHTTGYEDVSADYLRNMLKSDRAILQREVADRFIEKELGHKPVIDKTKVFEDAEGRKLTKEQVEFYKNSDVRDIRGRLIPVYHKTNANFTVFDKGAGKQHGNKYGQGFYFSITPENYGNNTMEVYLNAKDGEYKYIPKMGYYIVQNPNQIKNVDNLNPTEDADIRYQLNQRQENLPIGQFRGKDVRRDINVPTTQENALNVPLNRQKQVEAKTILPMVKNNDVLKVESQRIADEINKKGEFTTKTKSWLKTATESDALKGKAFIKDFDPKKINYVVQTNKESVDKANRHLNTYGFEKSLDYVNNLMQNDGLPKASDVALMQRMIQEAAKKGDAATTQELIMNTAILGTDLGQATQALSIIRKLTPEGQLAMYTKLVNRAKNRGEKSFDNVEITPKMVQNVLEAYNEDGTYDQDDLNARVEQFKQDIANQMKSTTGEKIDAWRYLSMLGNPKTHIRNIVSNIAMRSTIKVKNAVARTLETILPVQERTKTWKQASNEIKNYANKTADEMKGIITGENKYNEKSALESKKQIFKSKALEKISNFNSNALEMEDWLFSKKAFKDTLQEYLTANNINTLQDIENNPELVEKAKIYAVEQAEIATFRQYSKLAATINQLERKSKVGKLAVEALIPFKKTPINVAKAGVKYSPIGLLKSISYDAYQLRQGNINASQFIDNLSQGLTGTSLTILGYALAKAGILKGSGGDDKDDKYDSYLGNTGYSLKIGNNSYSISWLSPTAMPLLVGSNAYEQLEEGKDWDMNVVSDTLAKTLDPLNEMSFMQGLTNALQSYGSGVDKLKGSLESTAQNYVGQFFPTLFSQIAATTDDVKRSTKPSNDSKYKFGEQTVRSVMYKLPGLRQQLEPATDIWGNEKQQSENIIQRAFENFIAPYSRTENIATELDSEIKKVYNETGETKVIPSIPNAYVKTGNETYRMSAKEYTQYKETFGKKANTYLNNLINSSAYKSASYDSKAKMIQSMYDFAKAEANEQYFKDKEIDYTSDTLKELNELKNLGINDKTLPEYVSNKAQISSIRSNDNYTANEKHKKTADSLVKSSLNDKQLAYLYDKYYASSKTLNNLLKTNIPIKEYIKLNSQDFEADYNNKGKSISGSKETKYINYVNSLNLSVPQKAMLIKLQYKSFNDYDSQIINYVNNLNLSAIEKATTLKQFNFKDYDSYIINDIMKRNISTKEKEQLLKDLGFNVRNGVVYN